MIVKPFVKWAGGKSQLLGNIQKKYPAELGKTINKYCEPFVGGGAVLFDILSQYNVDEILINDINLELMNAYTQIKLHVGDLINELKKMQNDFWPLNDEQRKSFYYNKRERFNFLKAINDKHNNTEKAALFIFINKTCFNGLFRVNRKGLYNVPMGAYKKPIICDEGNLIGISRLLEKVTIKCGDFRDCLSFIDNRTFVYIDPPYRPITVTANFTAYAEIPFNDSEQIALGIFVDEINNKGAKIVISNSDPKNNDKTDNFFDDLYKRYNINRVTAKRMINCNGESRGNISELLICNY